MIDYIEYDPATGDIVRAGFCGGYACVPDPESGYEIALIKADPKTQRYIDGQLVSKTDGEILMEREEFFWDGVIFDAEAMGLAEQVSVEVVE